MNTNRSIGVVVVYVEQPAANDAIKTSWPVGSGHSGGIHISFVHKCDVTFRNDPASYMTSNSMAVVFCFLFFVATSTSRPVQVFCCCSVFELLLLLLFVFKFLDFWSAIKIHYYRGTVVFCATVQTAATVLIASFSHFQFLFQRLCNCRSISDSIAVSIGWNSKFLRGKPGTRCVGLSWTSRVETSRKYRLNLRATSSFSSVMDGACVGIWQRRRVIDYFPCFASLFTSITAFIAGNWSR